MAKEKFDFIQPIKDIPRTLKGFPKNIVRIVKDPVKNNDQIAERRRDIYPYLYLFGALFLIMVIVSVVVPSLQSLLIVVCMVPGFGVLGCVFLLNVLKKAAEKFADLECPNCKAQIQYSSDVIINVLKKDFVVTKKKDYMSSVDRQHVTALSPMYCDVNGKETTTAEITCKCQECGTTKSFTHSFVTAECNVHKTNIAAGQMDVILMQIEKDVREEGAEGFEGKTSPTDRGVSIKYNRQIGAQVVGYFGNTIQMR